MKKNLLLSLGIKPGTPGKGYSLPSIAIVHPITLHPVLPYSAKLFVSTEMKMRDIVHIFLTRWLKFPKYFLNIFSHHSNNFF